MYRCFEVLDDMMHMVEEARSVPMSANCVVPREAMRELIEDLRNALPIEVDDAQDVLDERDTLIGDARDSAETMVSEAERNSTAQVEHARQEADRIMAEAKARADRMVDEATSHARSVTESAAAEAERLAHSAQRDFEAVTGRARAEAARAVESGNATYNKSVADGIAEQQRLVSETEVVVASKSEAERIVDAAYAESDRLRGECDIYVDEKLADFEEILTGTLRSVGRGRQQLRTGAAMHDYVEYPHEIAG